MLDHLLAFLLLAVIPTRALWRSRTNQLSVEPKASRYLTTIGMAIVLLLLLIADWVVTHRPPSILGLGIPTTMPALIGIAIAIVTLTIFGLTARRKPASRYADTKTDQSKLLPETASEKRLFLILAVVGGFGWEILYRGFLLLYLRPYIGLIGAVVAAAVAYGAAHGFTGRGRFAASIASALAFTVGYAASGNLWWLIMLHVSLPLIGLFAAQSSDVSTDHSR